MMERSLNSVWSQCLSTIEPVLEELGFRLGSEAHHYASFGSASVEYERSDMRVELFWDGKEEWIHAYFATRNRNQRHLWSDRQTIAVEPPSTSIRAHVLRPGEVADVYIANLVVALRKLATGPRSLR